MNKKYDELKKNMQWIMIITKQNPELFHDGIGEEIYEVAKDSIKLLKEIEKGK